jgi:hypothetical protein
VVASVPATIAASAAKVRNAFFMVVLLDDLESGDRIGS